MDKVIEAQLKQNGATPAQQAKYLANIRLRDSFNEKQLKFINFVSPDAQSYLTDYFVLHEDMHSFMNEEYRKCYSDYSFVVLPIHKAFESYTTGVLRFVFNVEVDDRVPLGSYLKITPEKVAATVQLAGKKWGLSLEIERWGDRWKSLAECWNENRNPLIHSGGEKIETLRKAENIAATILREVELSSKMFNQDYFEPVLEIVRKSVKAEEEKGASENS